MIVILLEDFTDDTFVDTPFIDIQDSLIASLLLHDCEYGLCIIKVVRTDTLHIRESLTEGATTNMSIYFAITGIDLRYTFNCLASNAAANTLGTEMGKNVYIRGYIKDGLFYIAPTTVTYSNNPYYKCWTQDPVDETIEVDGVSYPVCYWLIGSAYYNSSYATRGYQVNLFHDNPMLVFRNGRLMEYTMALEKQVSDLQQQLDQFNSVVSTAIASLDERVRLLMG